MLEQLDNHISIITNKFDLIPNNDVNGIVQLTPITLCASFGRMDKPKILLSRDQSKSVDNKIMAISLMKITCRGLVAKYLLCYRNFISLYFDIVLPISDKSYVKRSMITAIHYIHMFFREIKYRSVQPVCYNKYSFCLLFARSVFVHKIVPLFAFCSLNEQQFLSRITIALTSFLNYSCHITHITGKHGNIFFYKLPHLHRLQHPTTMICANNIRSL